MDTALCHHLTDTNERIQYFLDNFGEHLKWWWCFARQHDRHWNMSIFENNWINRNAFLIIRSYFGAKQHHFHQIAECINVVINIDSVHFVMRWKSDVFNVKFSSKAQFFVFYSLINLFNSCLYKMFLLRYFKCGVIERRPLNELNLPSVSQEVC